MPNEITTEVKKLMCIFMRNGIKFWIYKDDYEKKKNAIMQSQKFVEIENNLLNVADITGIFDEEYVDDIQEAEDKRLKLKEKELKLKELTIR